MDSTFPVEHSPQKQREKQHVLHPTRESGVRSGYFYPVNLELAAAAVAAPAAAAAAVAAVI